MKNSTLLGGIMVAVGASSYGMLTTFVKIAEHYNYNVYEITLSEYAIGVPLLLVFEFFLLKKKPYKKREKPTKKNIRNLMLAGMSMGVTTFVYYFSVQFIDVSIAIVLLMQSVWIGVLLDTIINKTRPGFLKIIAVIFVLGGTLLATNIFFNVIQLDWRGIVLGFIAAISYSITILATNRIAKNLPAITRSKWMAIGALILVTGVTIPFLLQSFHLDILYTYGLFFGFFGAFLPIVLLNNGMPKVNLGVGAIISSMELPVAVTLAYLLLGEIVNLYQWIGILLILIAIVGMNLKKVRKGSRN